MSVDIKVEQNFWLQNMVLLATNQGIIFFDLLGLLAGSSDTYHVVPVTETPAKAKSLNQIITIPERFISKLPDTRTRRLAGYDTNTGEVVMVFDLEMTVVESILIPLLMSPNKPVALSGFDEDEILANIPNLTPVVKDILPNINLPELSSTGDFYYSRPFDGVGHIKWSGNGFDMLNSYMTAYRLGTCHTHALMGLYFILAIDYLSENLTVTLHMLNLFVSPKQMDLSKLEARERLSRFYNKEIQIDISGTGITFTILN